MEAGCGEGCVRWGLRKGAHSTEAWFGRCEMMYEVGMRRVGCGGMRWGGGCWKVAFEVKRV